MNFLEALEMSADFIRENQGSTLEEVYLFEPTSKTKIYLKDCEGGLAISKDEPLLEQLYAVLEGHNKENGRIRINELFCEWEVCIWESSFSKITSARGCSNV